MDGAQDTQDTGASTSAATASQDTTQATTTASTTSQGTDTTQSTQATQAATTGAQDGQQSGQDDKGTQTTQDTTAATNGQQTTTQEPFKLPEAYKDKPWASKIHSQEDLFKQIDNLQALVGKKTVVPDLEKASDKEREEYFAHTRPASAEAYEFPDTDYGPIDDDMKKGVADLMFKNGISAYQANNLIKGYQEQERALLAKQFSPDGMKQALKTAFGDDWENVTGQTRRSLSNFMSKEDNAMLDNIPNVYLGLIYRTMGNVVKAYGIKETDGAHFAQSGGHATTDIGSQRQAIRDQITALSQRPHTAAEKQELINKLNETYRVA